MIPKSATRGPALKDQHQLSDTTNLLLSRLESFASLQFPPVEITCQHIVCHPTLAVLSIFIIPGMPDHLKHSQYLGFCLTFILIITCDCE